MLQSQFLAGNEIQIPQSYTLKIGRTVNFDKGCQGLIQLAGKILPAGVAAAGEGDKGAGEVDPPQPILRLELVIGNLPLGLQFDIAGGTGQLGRSGFLAAGVLGKKGTNGLLKFVREGGFNGENLREAKLANYFAKLVFTITASGCI